MAYKEFTPCKELKEYIECFWTQTPSKFDANLRPTIDKILPDGCIDFLFRLDKTPEESTLTSGTIIGTMTTSIDVPRGKTKIVAVRFRPGGSLPFLQTPASFFTDQAIDLASIFGDSINQLIDQIFNADTLPQAVKILEKELLSKLRSSKKLDSNFIRDCKIITRLTPENYRKFLKMSDFSNPTSSNDNIRLETGGTHAI